MTAIKGYDLINGSYQPTVFWDYKGEQQIVPMKYMDIYRVRPDGQ